MTSVSPASCQILFIDSFVALLIHPFVATELKAFLGVLRTPDGIHGTQN